MFNNIICIISKKQLKKWASLVFTLLFMILISGGNVLSAPYDSYVYNFMGERTPSAQAYLPSMLVDGQNIGIDAFNRPRDMAISPENKIYVLDTGNNRIVVLNQDFSLKNIIANFDNNGEVDGFANPNGVAISDAGNIYVADTDNGRLVILDKDGSLIKIIGTESFKDEMFFADDFVYRPRKIEVDPLGRIYVIAANVYEGILQFDSDGKFGGFIGAPRVTPSLADIFWSRVASHEQRERQSLFLPIEYANFGLSKIGLLYAVVRGTAEDVGEEMIKLLNPAGSDVMRRTSQLPLIGDIEYQGTSITSKSSFVDILSRENDMFSVLDGTRGRVFTYSHTGDLLYVFGGIGDIIGRFRNPVSLNQIGDTLLVLDNRGITVFEPTVFANSIHNALALYHQGKYKESAEVWQQTLDMNPNYEFAYKAIATNALREKEYKTALEYAVLGQDRSGYSKAFSQLRHYLANRHIAKIMTGIVLLIPLIYFLIKFEIKSRVIKLLGLSDNTQVLHELAAVLNDHTQSVPRKVKVEYNTRKFIDSLGYAWYVIFHPFDGFWDLKHEKRGTVAGANMLLFSAILTYVFMRQYTAFTFNELDLSTVNIYTDASTILLLFGLWVGINWAFTTLMEGKGTLKDIYIMSAYSLTPFILLNIPSTVASHFLIETEGDLLMLVRVFSVIWFVGLLILGTMVLHEYSGFKTIVTMILIACGVAASLFVGLLFTSVIDHVARFALTLYTEIKYII